VSSHALDQDRVGGMRFAAAALTNLTRDHLDYHGSMEAYGAAKAKLFAWPQLAMRVFNVDDEFGATLAREYRNGSLITVSRLGAARAFESANVRWIEGVRARQLDSGLVIDIESSWGLAQIATRLVGDFNVDNVLLVFALLRAADVSVSDAVAALAQVAAPPGRMETFGGGHHPLAIVDYAHTPDALAKALTAARAHCRGSLTVVFGCGGDRDPGKRPLMGAVASRLADKIVLTDDNPRTESPAAIVAAIRDGLSRSVVVEHDRAAAIGLALTDAESGDVVLVAGKGHEDYQIYGREKRAFSDQTVIRAWMQQSRMGRT
jgi:UDP-N-acetylmuramoyl-L-alanyl-D-glutamate--2,6-diaminopimelate ligase